MTRGLTELGRRLFWAVLAFLHGAGMFAGFNWVANRFTAAHGGPFLRRRRSGNVQILVYHRVKREPDSFLPAMRLATFERQMECLARRFHVVDLTEALEAISRESVPDNAVVITFDDGYRDNFDVAWPVLSGLALPATVFLATGVIGTQRILWHDRVFHAFHETTAATLPGFGPDGGALRLDGPERRRAALDRVLSHLKSLDPERRDETIGRVLGRLGIAEPAPTARLMLSWEEVREMRRGGMGFGAHTVTHPVLSRLPIERAREEIAGSKREIERQVGAPVTLFAYPNGRESDFDATTKEILRSEGYAGAVTSIFGANPAPGAAWDPFEIRRGGPDLFDPPLFSAKMNVQKLLG